MEKDTEKEKEKELETLYNKLSEENKNIINLLAKGMQIAQENRR